MMPRLALIPMHAMAKESVLVSYSCDIEGTQCTGTPDPLCACGEGFILKTMDASAHPDSQGTDGCEVMPIEGTLACGSGFCCGIEPDGFLNCWGNFDSDINTTQSRFKQIDAYDWRLCGLTTDDQVECYGLGTPPEDRDRPATYTQIATAQNFACGIDSELEVSCYGYDEPEIPAGTKLVSIKAASYTVCASANWVVHSASAAHPPIQAILFRPWPLGATHYVASIRRPEVFLVGGYNPSAAIQLLVAFVA